MNWKQNLKNILMKLRIFVCNYKRQIIKVSIGILMIGILSIIAFYETKDSKSNRKDILESSNAENVEESKDPLSELQEQENEIDLEAIKKDYISLCDDYNATVELYNQEVERYRSVCGRISEYRTIDLPMEFNNKEQMVLDFELFKIDGFPFDNLKSEVQKLTVDVENLKNEYPIFLSSVINCMIDEYNTMAEEYEVVLKNTSVDFIKGVPTEVRKREGILMDSSWDEDKVVATVEKLDKQIGEIVEYYKIATQITNPSEEWVWKRLDEVTSITDMQAVTKEKDPNGLLGKKGGYSSCIYFYVQNIDLENVHGTDPVEKGTDAGGAIEIYPNLKSAKNRCDYLSQFDGTILYSGSYVLMGTMVIRTSCLLADEEQIEITKEIVQILTELREEE